MNKNQPLFDQQQFVEQLAQLIEKAKNQENTLTEGDVQDFFGLLHMDEQYKEHVYRYLTENHIQIGNDSRQKPKINSEETEYPLSEKDNSYLKMYLADLRKVKALEKEEEENLWKALESGDKNAVKRLLEGNLRLVVRQARQFLQEGVYLEDLIQEGNIALMTALQKLCAESQKDGRTYVRAAIKAAMEEMINCEYANESEAKAMVVRVDMVSSAAKQLKEELGREPNVAEVAEFTNLEREEIESILSLSADNLKI